MNNFLFPGVGLQELRQIQGLQTMRRSSDISVEDRCAYIFLCWKDLTLFSCRLNTIPSEGSTQLDPSGQCQISTSMSLCKDCKACMDASRVWAVRVVDI